MHFVAIRDFVYSGVSYHIGDGIYGSSYAAINQDVNRIFYELFVVPVADAGDNVSSGVITGTGGGPPDVPFVKGYYSIPGGSSTAGVFSVAPVRIMSIRNTSGLPQGAFVNLWDCTTVAAIPTAHLIGQYQLGPTQQEPVQILTLNGLCWSISVGDGSAGTTDNQQGLALNSIGGVDIDFANV